MIRIPQVRVVDEEGAQLGVMPTPRALEMAQERGLDLVEVAPMAAPPVVKFLDFGQYKYELTKREKEAKRKQRSVTFKEVRLSPKIGVGDFATKVNRAVEFLEDGDRIKVTVRFRGRELTHPELGRNLIARFVDRVKDHGIAERTPLLEGKSMHITMASTHKPKGHDAPAVRGGEATDGREMAASAGEPSDPTLVGVELSTAVDVAAATAEQPTTMTAAAGQPATAAADHLATAPVPAGKAAPVSAGKAAAKTVASASAGKATTASAEKPAAKTRNDEKPAPEPVRTGE